MCAPSPPAPPDPKETSAAQTGTNIGTAVANNVMQMMDQTTPYGSLTYSRVGGEAPEIEEYTIPGKTTTRAPAVGQGERGGFPLSGPLVGNITQAGQPTTGYRVGDREFSSRKAAERYAAKQSGDYIYTDPYTGKTYSIPRYTATTTLSPEQQAILDESQAAKFNLAALANERSDFLRDYLPGTEAETDRIDAKLYDLGSKRLDPRFAREEEALRTRLVNQGIAPGSEAYNREMESFGQTRNDAYNQLLLQGRGQAAAEVNMPINQITALLSGSQVSNPNVSLSQPQGAPTTDVAGLINANYNQKLAGWQQQQAQKQSLLGGMFGLGAGGLAGGYF